MKRRNILKTLLLATCCTACTVGAVTLTSCSFIQGNDGGISFVEEEKKVGPQFLEGALAEITVGETVVLEEYIEYVKDSKYTIVIADEKGKETDVTDRLIWTPKEPGTYTMTYTIASGKSKGTAQFVFYVSHPALTWSFTLQNKPYNLGDTLIFSKYFSALNIYASLREWDVYMDSVEVDGEVISLAGQTEYTFQSMSNHLFRFHIESPDGQRCEGRELISIKYVNEAYMQTLTEMGITTYGELYVDEGHYTMVQGSYCNGNNVWLRRENGPHDLPYIAYNGDYGINSFVKVDFTGKNMPILSFFRDDNYTQSIFDGSKGIVFTGGFTNNTGIAIHNDMCSCGTLYGPYMLHEYDRGAEDTTTIGTTGGDENNPYLGSLNSLVDNTHYRMIAGFSGLKVGKANKLGTTEPIDTVFAVFDCVIINLDTKEIFSRFTVQTYGLNALGFEDIPVEAEDNEFFQGNIVLYGHHGVQTRLDYIYPIITGKTFDEVCNEELQFSQFKDGAQTFFAEKGITLNVSDYVDTTAEGYQFFFKDEEGYTYEVTGATFTLEKSGSYTLYYTDGINLCATMNIFVGDFSEELVQWIKDNNVNFYALDSMTDEHKAILKAGTIEDGGLYSGPNAGNLVSQAYIAFDGEYSLNDYVAFDFTGKNMPEVAFFAKNYNNSMYYQDGNKQGVVFANGITTYNGELNTDILGNGTLVNIDSPFMMESIDTWFVEGGCKQSLIARANLDDNTRYRVVLGFKPHDAAAIQLNWYLYNLDTHAVVEEGYLSTWNFFNGGDHGRISGMTYDDLVGSIVLYGKFGVGLTIDKLWGVYEDTNIQEVVQTLNANETYTVTFKHANGEILKEVTNVQYGEVVSYDAELPIPDPAEDDKYIYSYVWDKEFKPIKGSTVYTLVLVSESKNGIKLNNVTQNGDQFTFDAGVIGAGANYTIGQNAGGSVNQPYIALGSKYSFNDYVAFDFTGKNMPEVMFFAKNYGSSMYYSAGKKGIVVASGITLWDGSIGEAQSNNTAVGVSGPFGAYFSSAAAPAGGNMLADFSAKLARANLVEGTQYRVIMGITKASDIAFTLKYTLYDLTNSVIVEEVEQTSWNFFTGDNTAVDGMTLNDLVGSIVLYGKFGTELTIDKLWGVYEDTNIEDIVAALNKDKVYTVTFQDENGETLKTLTNVAYGTTISYGEELPTPNPAEDDNFIYSYKWDKAFAPIIGDTVYTLVLVSEPKSGIQLNNVTQNGNQLVFGASNIGAGANYTIGQNAGGSVNQSYIAINGEYSFDDYIVFDFTGKNMPEVMFFAKNYDSSMYYTAGKQGVVVASGITLWNGSIGEAQSNNTTVGVSGPFGAYFSAAAAPSGGNMLADFSAKLARANLVDGTQYRIIMGITKASDIAFTLKYTLYDLTNNVIVEEVEQTSWNFFTGDNTAVDSMTLNDLVGSIVLYGKFGTELTIDKLWGVYEDTDVESIKSTLGMN